MNSTLRQTGVVLLSLLLCGVLSRTTFAISARGSLNRSMSSVKMEAVTLKDALDYVTDLSGANVNVNWKALEQAGVDKSTVVTMHLHDVTLRKALNVLLSQASSQNDLLTYYVSENVIEITTREIADQMMVTKVYPIDDLLVDVPDYTSIPDITQGSNSMSGQSGGTGGTSVGASSGSSSGGGGSSLFGSSSSSSQTKSVSKTEKAQQIIDLIEAVIRPDIWTTNGGKAQIRYFNGSLIVTAPRSVHEEISGPVD